MRISLCKNYQTVHPTRQNKLYFGNNKADLEEAFNETVGAVTQHVGVEREKAALYVEALRIAGLSQALEKGNIAILQEIREFAQRKPVELRQLAEKIIARVQSFSGADKIK